MRELNTWRLRLCALTNHLHSHPPHKMKSTSPYRPKYRTTTPAGTQIETLTALKVYGSGFPSFDGRLYILPGTPGVVAATDVPTVTGKDGRSFACIEFPPETEIYDAKGKRINFVSKSKFRVAAFLHEFRTL